MHGREGESLRPEGGRGALWQGRNRRFTAAGAADSGEESGQPGGAIRRGSRGEMEREAGAFIGVVRRPFWSRE
jgi:hypothetical protein